MLNELWAAEEAQAAAMISKVRCSFLLPSTQPSPIPEESEGPFAGWLFGLATTNKASAGLFRPVPSETPCHTC